LTTYKTRDKIRRHFGTAAVRIEQCLLHLKYIEGLAGERSREINEYLPDVVLALDELHKALLKFRESI